MSDRGATRAPDGGTRPRSSEGIYADRRGRLPLRPFHGFFTTGLSFTSGYCLCFYKWWDSPTALGAYESFFVVTPDGERRLYVERDEARRYVETYHVFDRTGEATITWTQATEDGIDVRLEAGDGTTISLRADLGGSAGTRLLTAIASLTPASMLRTSLGGRISNLTLGLLVDANDMKVVGRTERDEPYRVELDSLRRVTEGSATLNDRDLGDVCPPDRPIGFGDARVPNDPLITFGDLYLRPPSD